MENPNVSKDRNSPAFENAEEEAIWVRASLEYNIRPLDSKIWFYDRTHSTEAKWLSRNVFNMAFAFHDCIDKNLAVFNTKGMPRCARRLKRLLIYFLSIIEDFLHDEEERPKPVDLSKLGKADKALLTEYGAVDHNRNGLRDYLNKLDAFVHPQTPGVGSQDSVNNEDIPAEPMHELLGSLYIFKALGTNGGADTLKDRTNVRDLLRGMMTATESKSEASGDYEPSTQPKQKLGIPECIFSSRGDDVRTLLIGSTGAAYPIGKTVPKDAPVVPKPDNVPVEKNNARSIKAYFDDARMERFRQTGTPDAVLGLEAELMLRFRNTDHAYMDPLARLDLKQFPEFKKGISQKLVNFYIQQRRRSVNNWKMFDHQDQTSTSFLVCPRDRKSMLKDFNNEFFQPVPRCLKCRTIQSYIIPVFETQERMDKYLTLNEPFACAEDIVHAKLRVLHRDKPIPKITTDSSESMSTLIAFDIALKEKNDQNHGTMIQSLAKNALELMQDQETLDTDTEKLQKIVDMLAAWDLEDANSGGSGGEEPSKGSTPEEKKAFQDYRAAKAKAAREKDARGNFRSKNTGAGGALHKNKVSKDNMEGVRIKMVQEVHEYLQLIQEPDLTGEDKIRPPGQ